MIASFLNEILKQSFLIIWCECRLIDEKVLKSWFITWSTSKGTLFNYNAAHELSCFSVKLLDLLLKVNKKVPTTACFFKTKRIIETHFFVYILYETVKVCIYSNTITCDATCLIIYNNSICFN